MSTKRKGRSGNSPRALSRVRGDDLTSLGVGVPQTETPPNPHGSELSADTPATRQRIGREATDAVLSAFNFGRRELLKLLPDLKERGVPPRHIRSDGPAKITAQRRKIARELVLYLGLEDACKAARNLALSPHHRGENDRKTAYYDLQYVGRAPDKMLARCSGDDQAFLRILKASARKAGWGRMEGS